MQTPLEPRFNPITVQPVSNSNAIITSHIHQSNSQLAGEELAESRVKFQESKQTGAKAKESQKS
jgi:hypothetical protein